MKSQIQEAPLSFCTWGSAAGLVRESLDNDQTSLFLTSIMGRSSHVLASGSHFALNLILRSITISIGVLQAAALTLYHP